jgi:hypothetical protein
VRKSKKNPGKFNWDRDYDFFLKTVNINGQFIVPSLCFFLCVIIKSPRNSINGTTMIFLGGELNAPKRQAQGHLKDVLHDFAHE